MNKIFIIIMVFLLIGCGGDKFRIYKTHSLFNHTEVKYLSKDSKFIIIDSDNYKTLEFKIQGNIKQQCVDKVPRSNNLIFSCKSILKLADDKDEPFILSIFMPVNSPNDCDKQAYDTCQTSEDVEKCFCIYLDFTPKPGDEVGTGGNLN